MPRSQICPELEILPFLRASVAGDGATSTQAHPFHLCGVHRKWPQFLLTPGSPAVRFMLVITGLKGHLTLGKQTEALPSLPVGNFGLSCRTDAWETHFKSRLQESNCSWRSAKAASGQCEGQEALLQVWSRRCTLDGDHLHQGFSPLCPLKEC